MHLKLARKIAGLTQQQLAKQAGVTNSFICLIESGKRDIRLVGYETVVRIAHALGVSPDDLFPLADDHPRARTKRPA
jgi:transcriptional regulator with XRE-family HTH domain